jgi:hypothetical protein
MAAGTRTASEEPARDSSDWDVSPTRLHEYLEGWLAAKGKIWSDIVEGAGINWVVVSNIRKGSQPRAETLRALSAYTQIPMWRLLELADYLRPGDLPFPGGVQLTPQEEQILELLRVVSPEARQIVLAGLRTAAAPHRRQPHTPDGDPDTGPLETPGA